MLESEDRPENGPCQTGPIAALAALGPFDQVAVPFADAGMATVPCEGKRPLHNAWEKTTPEKSREWARSGQYAHCNVGVLGGAPSGVVFLDDDTGDPEVDALIERLFPSPWRRVGAKGAVRGYRFNGEETTRLKDKTNRTLVELLSTGTQAIVPPSIHPTALVPYVANVDSLEALPRFTTLPADFWTPLRRGLVELGYELEKGGKKVAAPKEGFAEGGRNTGLFRLARRLHASRTLSDEAIRAAIQAENARCQPPLDDGEVDQLLASAAGYPTDERPRMYLDPGAIARNVPLAEELLNTVEYQQGVFQRGTSPVVVRLAVSEEEVRNGRYGARLPAGAAVLRRAEDEARAVA